MILYCTYTGGEATPIRTIQNTQALRVFDTPSIPRLEAPPKIPCKRVRNLILTECLPKADR